MLFPLASKMRSREEGSPPLRDSICTHRALTVLRMTQGSRNDLAKQKICGKLKITEPSRVPLRWLPQFAPIGHTCHTWHLLSNKDRCARGRHRPLKSRHFFSRGRDRARSGNGTPHLPFPSSKAVKAPPGLCQESAFSPLTTFLCKHKKV